MRNLSLIATALLCSGSAFADWDSAADALANRTPFAGTASRSDVSAELDRAIVAGNVFGAHGVPVKWLAPYAYPPSPQVAGRTRAEVQAELDSAIRDGDMLVLDQSGMTANQRYPTMYARSDTLRPVVVQAAIQPAQ